jgi:hypothetical protein
VDLIAPGGYRLLPDYRFHGTPGCGTTATGHPNPQLGLHEVTWAHDANLTYPCRHSRPGEKAFACYLRQARALLAALSATSMTAPPGFPRIRGPALVSAAARLPPRARQRASTDAGCCQSPLAHAGH